MAGPLREKLFFTFYFYFAGWEGGKALLARPLREELFYVLRVP